MTTFAEPGHIPRPDGGEAADGPTQIGAVADRLAALFTGITTAQRDALAGTDLWTGRRIYNTTTARTEEYTGSAWRAIGSIDLSAHEADSDPHTGYTRKTTLTAKGDLYVATASGVIARKAVGADGRVLTADSAQSDGLAWTTPSAGAMALIAATTLGSAAASISFASIPATYGSLRLVAVLRCDTSASNPAALLRFNGDAGTNYGDQGVNSSPGGGVGQVGQVNGTGIKFGTGIHNPASDTGDASPIIVDIPLYKDTTWRKTCHFVQSRVDEDTSTNNTFAIGSGVWASTAAINQVTILLHAAGNLVAGSYAALYGIADS